VQHRQTNPLQHATRLLSLALAALGRLVGAWRDAAGRRAETRARTAADGRQAHARAHFWAEVRAGQREADALNAGLAPVLPPRSVREPGPS